MIFTFGLLAFSVCSVWLKDIRISNYLIPLWMVFLIAAMIMGVINSYLEFIAIFWIIIFGLLTYSTKFTTKYRLVHVLHLILIGCMAFLLAIGKFSGFNNPNIITDMRFSSEGAPFTHRLHFDKISAGIILLAFMCRPARTWREWSIILRKSAPIILAALIVIFGCGLLLRYVAVDVKFVPYTLVFLISNLLFTCVLEECFFRGLVQENISKLLTNWKYSAFIAIGFSAFLFGFAHIKGGFLYVGLATLAGLFYGYAKYRVKHIEAAILTHFSVNAVHFIAFTYPNL